jgi:hypothetical protein
MVQASELLVACLFELLCSATPFHHTLTFAETTKTEILSPNRIMLYPLQPYQPRHSRGLLDLLRLLQLMMCCACCVAVSELSAQSPVPPQIAYILPDVCAPNMNTYIEIFAPRAPSGGFLRDGVYNNSPTNDVRVVLANPERDSSKVVLGPVVVSWQGRLISTQVFVLPNVRPNSSRWDALRAEFRIPIRVRTPVGESNADTLYIVQPFAMGNLVMGQGTVFGEGSLGVRSPRGAMIVDSLRLLPNTVYTVSTNDCDPRTEGIQGFLPFVLLSTGLVDGRGSTINVGGNGIQGGPGGGGGGGQVCDANPGSANGAGLGTQGGNGYTGGGGGGFNGTGGNASARSSFQNAGFGSGSAPINEHDVRGDGGSVVAANGGRSLTGVPGGRATNTITGSGNTRTAVPANPESAGGGTGHPFGISGRANRPTDASATDEFLTFGGGDGGGQRPAFIGFTGFGGDGGGYGSAGNSPTVGNNNAANARNQGGRAHGNSLVIPLAGGSGGGSGNAVANCGGHGGGGGGAIRLFAPDVRNLVLLAKGSDGGVGARGGLFSPTPADGGGGSGGHVGIQTKSTLGTDVVADVSGGVSPTRSDTAGYGRVRIDVPSTTGFNVRPSGAFGGTTTSGMITSLGVGITSDTSTLARSPFSNSLTIRGSYGGVMGSQVRLYYRTLSRPWQFTEQFMAAVSSIPTWSAQIPALTQAANPEPSGAADSIIVTVAMQSIPNPSSDPLSADPPWAMSQAATNMLRVPKLPLVLAPSAATVSQAVVITTPQGSQTRRDTLRLSIANCRDAELLVRGLQLSQSSRAFRLIGVAQNVSPENPLGVPVARPTLEPDNVLRFREQDFGRQLVEIEVNPTLLADSIVRDTLLITHNDTLPDVQGSVLRFVPELRGRIANPDRRENVLRVPLTALIQSYALRVDMPASINFGNVPSGSQATREFIVTNTGTTTASFSIVSRIGDQQQFVIEPAAFTTRNIEPGGTYRFSITFVPSGVRSFQQDINIRIASVEPRLANQASIPFTVRLEGSSLEPILDASQSSQQVRTELRRCLPADSAMTRTADLQVQLFNAGNDVLQVLSQELASRLRGAASSGSTPFSTSATAVSAQPQSSGFVRLRFEAPNTTQASVQYTDTLIIRHNGRTNNPWRVALSVNVATAVFDVRIDSTRVDFGNVNFLVEKTVAVTLRNVGNIPVTIDQQMITQGTMGVEVYRAGRISTRLEPNAVQPVTLTFAPPYFQPPDPRALQPMRPIQGQWTLTVSAANAGSPVDSAGQRCRTQTLTVPLVGTPADPPKLSVAVWADTLNAVEPSRDTAITIYSQILTPSPFQVMRGETFVGTLRIGNAMFFPQRMSSDVSQMPRITRNVLTTNPTTGTERVVSFEVPNVILGAGRQVLARLSGSPILSSTTLSVLRWERDSVAWRSTSISSYTTATLTPALQHLPGDGLLVMTVCYEAGAPRLIAPTRSITLLGRTMKVVHVLPNPASDVMTVNVAVPSAGEYSVHLVSLLGERTLLTRWTRTANASDAERLEMSLPLASVPSGVYYLELLAPYGRETVLVQIAK